jgi:FKBP-type peptidyl-prolyl cis-trans isomerase 2
MAAGPPAGGRPVRRRGGVTVKMQYTLTEDDLKKLVAKRFGVKPTDVTFGAYELRDAMDRPCGGHSVWCEVEADVAPDDDPEGR